MKGELLSTISGSYKTSFQTRWELRSQSKENNTSTIRLYGYLYTENTTTISSSYSTFKINGKTIYSGSYSKSGAGYLLLGYTDITVTHNDDGSFPGKTISSSADSYIVSGSDSGKISSSAIEDIPRESKVLCSSLNIGEVATITVDRNSTSFTSTLTYKIGTLEGTIATKTTKETIQFSTNSLKEAIYALIPNAKQISGTIYCKTYSGNTQIGETTSTTFKLYAVEEDCKPDISGVVIDTNQSTIDLTGDSSIIVKNASKPKVTISATPKYSSTIKSYSINLNDGQTSSLQEHTFNTINSDSITIKVTDSRGYSKSNTIDLSDRIIDYVKLHFNKLELERTEGTSSEVVLNANGVWFNGNFKENLPNTLAISYRYRESGTTEWTEGGEITPTIDGNTFAFNELSLGNIYDYEKEYEFQIIAVDLLNTIGNTDKEIEIVAKGLETYAVGEYKFWHYGELYLNDEKIVPYQVGDVVVTNTNTNPSERLGGTWVLLNKEFTSGLYNPGTDAFTNGDGFECTDCWIARNSNGITMRLSGKTTKAIGDTTVNLGTINVEVLGITRFPLAMLAKPLGTDAGNGICLVNISTAGVVDAIEFIPKVDGNTLASGTTLYIEISVTTNSSYMLDAKCNKFYWRKTA